MQKRVEIDIEKKYIVSFCYPFLSADLIYSLNNSLEDNKAKEGGEWNYLKTFNAAFIEHLGKQHLTQ